MKNKHLEIIFKALQETKLSLADARIRDAFMKPLVEKLKEYEENKTKIFIEYCVKDDDGKPVQEKPNTYKFEGEDTIKKVNEEIETLLNEEVKLELTDKLKDFINQTEYKPLVGEVELLDEALK